MRKLTTAELLRPSLDDLKTATRRPLVVLLDNVRSAYNVGAVFRTADAFRIQQLILSGICAVPPNRELMKTALGSVDSVPWSYYPDGQEVLKQFKQQGAEIVVVEQTDASQDLQEFALEPQRTSLLVFGNELTGVGESLLAWADRAVAIPQFGYKHSLNLVVAVGIVLWELCRKHQWLT